MDRRSNTNKIHRRSNKDMTDKGNKYFKSNHLSYKSISIIENYLSAGLLPGSLTTMNSLRMHLKLDKDKNSKSPYNNNREYYEFDKSIKGTKITTKVKIYKINDIDRDCSFEELNKFELLAEANEWSDETMGSIFYDLIEDEKIKSNLTTNSYIKLRQEIISLKYPVSEHMLYLSKLHSIKQEDFIFIMDYLKEIEELAKILSNIRNLSKKEFERMISDAFFMGLGKGTSLEVVKNTKEDDNLMNILKYLKRIENHIITQSKVDSSKNNKKEHDRSKINKENYFLNKINNNKPNQWCKIHKASSHKTKDCFLNNKSKNDKSDEKPLKCILIKEIKEEPKKDFLQTPKHFVIQEEKEFKVDVNARNANNSIDKEKIIKNRDKKGLKNSAQCSRNLNILNDLKFSEEVNVVDKNKVNKIKYKKVDRDEKYNDTCENMQSHKKLINVKNKNVKNSLNIKNEKYKVKMNHESLFKHYIYKYYKKLKNKILNKSSLYYKNKNLNTYEIEPNSYFKPKKVNNKIYKKGVKIKTLTKDYKTRIKHSVLNLNKVVKRDYRPPPVIKRNKIIGLNYDSNIDLFRSDCCLKSTNMIRGNQRTLLRVY
ncbi:hypothetical protein NAPIS_ORF00217 [Vairimorpha apis BRL 01]|uniref:Uncharacterized protein n=1 Tax=Vairimorpha apis BRL 01 TaxID=1037528 RepID=T0LD33_9MICR|nr:hypothetical protein NAPIS_ORF00217 [Vairimorpha apis BRL 01]